MNTSKSHIDYWKAKLRKQKLYPDCWDTTGRHKNWEIYLQHRGRREWFNLGTPNKDAAAAKAREIWTALRANGWEKALETFKPGMVAINNCPTVGEFLALIESHSTLRPATLYTYGRKLRTLVAAISGQTNELAKFDQHNGGHDAWLAKIQARKLSFITATKILAWKRAMITRAGDDPLAQRKARHTINSTLRNIRALFADKLLKNVPVIIDAEFTLRHIEFERAGKVRYKSRIDALALLQLAREELRKHHPEAYKIFLLALTAGLRRKEIDGLLWSQIDFARCKVQIETHEYSEVKTSGSEEEIDLEANVLKELREFYEQRFPLKPDFVVLSDRKPKRISSYHYYRCNPHFVFLLDWLRKNGVQSDKPLHTLRKEFGSLIASKHGIFAASFALRHSNITTTREHYLDKKEAITAELSG